MENRPIRFDDMEKLEVQLEKIDASLAKSASEREAKSDRLLKKALFGSRKRAIPTAAPRGLASHETSAGNPKSKTLLDKVPEITHDMHVSIINEHAKALGSKSEGARETIEAIEEEIAEQAHSRAIPISEYRDKLADMEPALRSLEPLQMYNLKVHQHLQSKLGPVEVPEQYKAFPAIAIQKEQQERQKLQHDRATMTYKKASESFRQLFCIQCATFDCQFHSQEIERNEEMEAAIAIQYDQEQLNSAGPASDGATVASRGSRSQASREQRKLASLRANDPFRSLEMPLPPPDGQHPFRPASHKNQQLSSKMQHSLSRLAMIFENSGGDIESLKTATGRRYSRDLRSLSRSPKASLCQYGSLRQTYYASDHDVKKHLHMDTDDQILFFPCSHSGPCTTDNADCTCIANNQICTKQCVWGKYGANKYKGCQCRDVGCNINKFARHPNGGIIPSSQCDCIVDNRECDPEICDCSCSLDQRNQQIMRHRDRRASLFIAPSRTLPHGGAGWGLFAKRYIAALAFVAEVGSH